MLDKKTERLSTVRRRILLVEDDAGVRRSLHLMLHGGSYDVRSYPAAQPLLADVGVSDDDVLVADYRLPDVSGIELRRTLAERGWKGRSVMITAFPSDALVAEAKAVGYDAVLDKPARQHELIAAID